MTIFTDKCKIYVPRLMKDLQITRVQACGIMGNIGTETGGFKHLQEIKPVVAGSRGGYGWMQWTGPRRKKYEAWAKANNLDPAQDETNYRFLVHETLTDEYNSLVGLRKTTTIKASTETFMLLNLRPGVQHLDNRIQWGQRAMDATEAVAIVVEDKKKEETQDKTGAALATGGFAVVLMLFFREHWQEILIGAAVIGAAAWFLVQRYHAHEQEKVLLEQALKTEPTKKGKKNG